MKKIINWMLTIIVKILNVNFDFDFEIDDNFEKEINEQLYKRKFNI
jgi:hypothetical protein